MKKGDEIEGFEVLDVVSVPDCASEGVYLKHKTLGMEVFHLVNSDSENLFAFAFRTPAKDSTGVAHIMEHSVLCGSKNYPLSDPFIRLANQSIKTYLNAYTSSDHTVFPASSQVRDDYFNLFGVYADAVFFPLLKKEIFLQEGHRLDLDQNGKPCIQGVVYNEMKGSYSSFDSTAGDEIDKVVFAGTDYENDSGGDPLVIPSLTYNQFKNFHKKYYCPANCCLFLYGNIPTAEQLRFVNERVLKKFSCGGKKYSFPKTLKPSPLKKYVHTYAPSDSQEEDAKNTVVLAWRIQTKKYDDAFLSVLLLFLGDLLWGDDCAPVAKALLDSGLGEDLAPETCEDIRTPLKSMCVGLRGVKTGDARKVQDVVMQSLAQILKTGLSAEDIERTSMRFLFSSQEIKRYNGPYSLVYLRRALRSWIYGGRPWDSLLYKNMTEKILLSIKQSPDFLTGVIRELLTDNTERSLIVISPSESWTKKRNAQEKQLAQKLYALTTERKVNETLLMMQKAQSVENDKKIKDCIPHLSVSSLSCEAEKINTQVASVNNIPLFVNRAETNGIVYADVAFPIDVLDTKDYVYLSTLANSLVETGWAGCPWHEALSKINAVTGGFGAYIRHAQSPEKCLSSPDAKEAWFDRAWLVFHFKALEEQTEKAFNLLADCINKTDFADLERLSDIAKETHNNGISSVLPSGHSYAVLRACCKKNQDAAVSEVLEGLSSLYYEKMIADSPAKKTSAHLNRIFKTLKAGGAVLHVTATKKGLTLAKKCLEDFTVKTNVTPPVKKRFHAPEEFYELTEIPKKYRVGEGTKNSSVNETFIIPGTVGFLGLALDSAGYDSKACIADEVFCHSAQTQEFWNTIRIKGGAYGVMFSPDSDSSLTRFATYRDPEPFKSLQSFKQTCSYLAKKTFARDEVEKAVLGCYSSEIEPRTPASCGATGFLWKLYGLTNAQKQRRLKWLCGIKNSDLHAASVRYSVAMQNLDAVVLCASSILQTKNAQTTGIIYKLPV